MKANERMNTYDPAILANYHVKDEVSVQHNVEGILRNERNLNNNDI